MKSNTAFLLYFSINAIVSLVAAFFFNNGSVFFFIGSWLGYFLLLAGVPVVLAFFIKLSAKLFLKKSINIWNYILPICIILAIVFAYGILSTNL